MRSVQRATIVGVVPVLSAGSLRAADAQLDKKVADHFTVAWSAIRYNKTATIYNPKVSAQAPEATEGLTLSRARSRSGTPISFWAYARAAW